MDDEAFLPSIPGSPPEGGATQVSLSVHAGELSVKFRKAKARSHEEGGDRKPGMCAWGN